MALMPVSLIVLPLDGEIMDVSELSGELVTLFELSGEIGGCCVIGNVSMFRGDNQTLRITVKDATGAVVDLTGASARFTVRESEDFDALIEKSSDDPAEIDITDPLNGILHVYLIPADTRSLKPGTFVFDVEVTVAGEVHTVTHGAFVIRADVTY